MPRRLRKNRRKPRRNHLSEAWARQQPRRPSTRARRPRVPTDVSRSRLPVAWSHERMSATRASGTPRLSPAAGTAGRPVVGARRLRVCSDLSPADWIVASDLPWQRLVTFGPAGFPAYARVRFIADPIREDQQESEADPHASPEEVDQWPSLLKLLAAATEDADDCYFGLWE